MFYVSILKYIYLYARLKIIAVTTCTFSSHITMFVLGECLDQLMRSVKVKDVENAISFINFRHIFT